MRAYRQEKKFFILSFIFPLFVFAQLPLSMETINRSYLCYLEGNEAAAKGYWEKAYLILQESIQTNPTDQPARFSLHLLDDILDERIDRQAGLLLFKTLHALDYHDKNEAKDQLFKAEESLQIYAPYHLICGMLEEAFKRKASAVICYNKALTIDNKNILALYRRGKAYLALKEVQHALADLTNAIELSSTFDDAFFERGRAYQSLRMFPEAIEDYKHAYQLNHALKKVLDKSLLVCEAYNQQGTLHLRNKAFEKALTDFNQAIAWNPYFPEPYLNRATVYREMHMLASARSDIEQVIALDPTNAKAYFQRGLIYLHDSDVKKAEKDWLKAKNLDPQYAKVFLELGEMYYGQHNYDQAISILQEILPRTPDDCWIHYWLALSYDANRRFKEAIVHYEQFVKLAPEDYFEHRVKMWERAERLKEWINRKVNEPE